jgi:YD repeat-containing protein
MGKSNTELLKIAQKHLGQGGAVFRRFCGLPAGSAWCNAFVCYVANEGGDSSLYFDGRKMTYCPTSMKWCRSNLAQIPIYLALPMDIIYFDWEPNGVPNHIGFVRERKSDEEIYTIEGNTSGGIVAQKTRTAKYVCGCFRPHFKPTGFSANTKLTVDGYFGYNSIAVMQKWLGVTQDGVLGIGTVKALQKKLGVTQDGSWGPATSRALQKLIGTTADGAFGPKSVKAFQTYLNNKVFAVTASTPSTPVKTTNADKIVAKAKDYAWAYGTAQSKWAYKTGSAKSSYKSALKKYLKHTTKIAQSDCGYFVTTCVRASGVSSSFLALKGAKEAFPSVPSTMKIVWKGAKIPSGTLKAGDIVRYKKTSGSQHTLMYIGDGKIAEAGRKIRYPRIAKDTKKYNASGVKFSTIQVIRAK